MYRHLFTEDEQYVKLVSLILIEKLVWLPIGFVMLEDFYTLNIRKKNIYKKLNIYKNIVQMNTFHHFNLFIQL